MVSSPNTCLCLFVVAGLIGSACRDGTTFSNSSPRINTVPAQSTTGGSTFTLTLSDYVTDRESASLTYSVVSGGGSFGGTDGSQYSHMFDTMGTYDVTFTATDGPKTATGTFSVAVTSANFAVVTEDSQGLLLLDTATGSFLRITGTSQTPTFLAGIGTEYVVYRLGASGDLFTYEPFTRTSTKLAADVDGPATYVGKTSDGRILYTTGTAPNITLWYYNPLTEVARDLDAGGLGTQTVLVNASDIVFYEAGVGGQADIWYYDPTEDETVEVSAESADEQLQAVLPNGGIVFTRVGSGGELDLFYFRIGTGLVEIGSDVTALATRNKAYAAAGSGSQVVFTATNGANDELYFWNPTGGATTAIATGVDTSVVGVGAGNEVVYNTIVSSTEEDASFYDLDDATTAVVRNASDKSVVTGIVDGGTTRWAIVRGDGATSSILAISLIGTPATQTYAAGGAATHVGTLANGDVIATRDDGTAINVFDVSAGTWGTALTGTGISFGGDGLEDGDFVFVAQNTSQDDLYMWDASASGTVGISLTTGDDAFAAKSADGTILFTRIVGSNTNKDLFSWDGTTATQLTDEDANGIKRDHAVIGQFAASR